VQSHLASFLRSGFVIRFPLVAIMLVMDFTLMMVIVVVLVVAAVVVVIVVALRWRHW
jgi:hypothetical protein